MRANSLFVIMHLISKASEFRKREILKLHVLATRGYVTGLYSTFTLLEATGRQ